MEHFGLESLDDLPGVDELEGVGILDDAEAQAGVPGAAPVQRPLGGEDGDTADAPEEPDEADSPEEEPPTVVPLSGRSGPGSV